MGTSTPSPRFAALLMALGRQPQERTRNELFDALGLNDGDYFLTKLAAADRALRECGIEVQPRLQDEPPEGVFLLRQVDAGVPSEAVVLDRLARLESSLQEFKSTYWCDFRRLSNQPGVDSQELRSESVKHSALKSIAGFLTTGGGTLFIGVDDAGVVLGLQPDLRILSHRRRNVDQLINNIRTDIADRFLDGDTVNDYVTITTVDIGDAQILQLAVASRRRLSFLASPGRDHQLFRRQGNRTTTVKLYELEEFQAWRNEHILPGPPT